MKCFLLKEHQLIREIRQQPSAIIQTVTQEDSKLSHVSKFVTDDTRFLGMGSSYFASLYAKYLLQEVAHIDVGVGASSEFLHYPTTVRRGQVFFVVSQSGESVETVKAARFLRRKKATIIAVTNEAQSSLAATSHATLLMHAGEERASATKTFTSTLALFHSLAFSAAMRKRCVTSTMLVSSKARLISCAKSMEAEIPLLEKETRALIDQIKSYRSIAILARGFNFASALQGALLFKEVVKVHAEGMTAGEFMHGPAEMASPELLAIVLTGGRTSRLVTNLVGRLKKAHAEVLTIGPQTGGATRSVLLKEIDEILLPFPSIFSINLIVYFAALKHRLDPDRFNHISKVTLAE
jgi:glucosamine--fructose-6-phosphate aminotransferase (isomerizing)